MAIIEVIAKLFDILWWIVEFLFPVKFTVIDEGDRGIRYTCGQPGRNLDHENGFMGTGLHLATMFQRLETKSCIGLVAEMEEVNVFTKEGVPLSIWAAVTYDITDYRLSAEQYDLEARVQETVTADLLERFSKLDLEKATGSMKSVEGQLMKAMAVNLAPLGCIPSAAPRITGREINDSTMQTAFLIAAIQGKLEVTFTRTELAAILAGASIIINPDNDDEHA